MISVAYMMDNLLRHHQPCGDHSTADVCFSSSGHKRHTRASFPYPNVLITELRGNVEFFLRQMDTGHGDSTALVPAELKLRIWSRAVSQPN